MVADRALLARCGAVIMLQEAVDEYIAYSLSSKEDERGRRQSKYYSGISQ